MLSLGADFAFDYTQPDVGARIREQTANQLKYAWDTISTESSARICADALSTSSALGLRYGNLLPVQCPRKDVRTTTTVMYTVFGRDFRWGGNFVPASKEDYEFGRMFYGLAEKLMASVCAAAVADIFTFSLRDSTDIGNRGS